MLKVGITGGIGSGKTTVSKIFQLLNVPVYDADAASKQLYHTDKDLMAKVKHHFGDDIYAGGMLDKPKLSQIVFSDQTKLHLLNSIVHPPTIKHATDWMNNQKGVYLIKEAALLFESGSANGLDYVIGVYAPEHLRIKRAMDRDAVSRNSVMKRIGMQMDERIKMKLCNFIITNDEQQAVIPQVLHLHERLLKLAREKEATLGQPMQ